VQKELLLETLSAQAVNVRYNQRYPDIIDVTELTRVQISSLVKNFDIIKTISGTRPVRIRPGVFGQIRRDYGFQDLGLSWFPYRPFKVLAGIRE
jgi:hypothetical protein